MQRTSTSFESWFGALVGAWGSWLEFGLLILISIWLQVFDIPIFWILDPHLILKVQRKSMSFKSWFGASVGARCFWLGFSILISIWRWSLVFDTPRFLILALYLDFEVPRTSISFNSRFWALKDAGGSWLGFGILISNWIWSLVSDLALAFGFGFWLGLWFLHSRVKKICWPRFGFGFEFGWVGLAKVKD